MSGMSGDKTDNLGSIWLRWRERVFYPDGVEFDPSHVGTRASSSKLNLFWGWPFPPAPADKSIDPYAGVGWPLLRQHMLENMASGAEKAVRWALHWLANAVQRPDKKPGTGLVLYGPEGVGKTQLAMIFMKLFGADGHQASKKDGISGQFNAAMFGRIMVVAEETDWAGDKKAEGHGKTLRAETQLMLIRN
jgi:hypothetical protein